MIGLIVAALLGGGYSTAPGLPIVDEATPIGRAQSLVMVGTSVACVNVAGVVTCTVTGGSGGFAPTEVEIDFGVDAKFTVRATVTDGTVSGTSKIVAFQSGAAATGRQADENEMDEITCRAIPGTGNFSLICTCARSVTHGKFKILYQVG